VNYTSLQSSYAYVQCTLHIINTTVERNYNKKAQLTQRERATAVHV